MCFMCAMKENLYQETWITKDILRRRTIKHLLSTPRKIPELTIINNAWHRISVAFEGFKYSKTAHIKILNLASEEQRFYHPLPLTDNTKS